MLNEEEEELYKIVERIFMFYIQIIMTLALIYEFRPNGMKYT